MPGTEFTPPARGALPEGDIRFFDNVAPALAAGDYVVSFSQRLNPTSDPHRDKPRFPTWTRHSGPPRFSRSQAPRYNLASGEVFSCFPPDNAVGIYEQALPHVVFTRRDLPWERDMFAAKNPPRRVPWLALSALLRVR